MMDSCPIYLHVLLYMYELIWVDWKMRRRGLIFIDPWVVKATLCVSAIIIHCYLQGEKLKIEDIACKQIV